MVTDFPTIARLHAAYAAGATPEEIVAGVYGRLAVVDDPGIFITLVPEAEAKAAAAALGPYDPDTKPLWGVPFAVKDNIDVAGLPTTAACPAFEHTAEETAFAVQRLLDAGAILIGKTNLDQFAMGLVGVRSPYPPPRNAFDPAIVPGGSSSGSAVCVAQGVVPFALGTDTAGSGRVPAGLNNVVGLKPSLGTLSSHGVVPACQTLDTISVFAGTVADAEAVYRVMSVFNPADPWSRDPSASRRPSAVPPGLRVGVPDAAGRQFGGDALSEAAFDAALEDLQGQLATAPTPVDMAPFFAVASLLYTGPWIAERYQAIRAIVEQRPEVLHPTTRQIVQGASAYSAADAFAGLYQLKDLARQTEALWNAVDVLAVPTYPRPRSVADLAADPIGPNSELGTYTNFVNLLDLCAIAVPSRFRADGFPAGLTLIAPRGRDGLLSALAARLQAAADIPIGHSQTPVPAPGAAPERATDDEIELVVVGAHLSGMALNPELTGHGARFLRAGTTTPDYRLYALAGGPPERPGLLRVAEGEGVAIDTEVWAVPVESFARFVAGIPAPLGIGTCFLADGTTPRGFIVEAEGLKGAVDISRFGCWRAYQASRTPSSPS
ncbi:allophanate hydrolase [Roseospira marina]|uniref:Allophanate hydrolase n=1 Tax=Roseospira marina TaxID=140057 RepID=A0A5M6ICE5_9PROT|nr:allophanate hydrolase [Roseospira marina]KAA5605298.1 allophanate hydrolase [Roseospira marina]MBB4314766.1 allophanate hydrolase [Roseospira marina]MBB5087755.1 allophanate hydrolase [Roseospira marina]